MSTATMAETAPELGNEHDQLPMETDEALYELVNGKRVEMPAMSIRRSHDRQWTCFGVERICKAESAWKSVCGITRAIASGRGPEPESKA